MVNTTQDIWTELGDRVRKFVGRRVRDAHTADDITQEVMLKVQARLNGGDMAREMLPAWVFTVARNAVTDHYRDRAGRRNHLDVDSIDIADESHGAGSGDAIGALAPCLVRMAESLPEPYRLAMKLADFDGLPQQEIADRMGISLSGAKSRVQRARRQLRMMVLDCCHIEQDVRGNVIGHAPTARAGRYCGDDERTPVCGQ